MIDPVVASDGMSYERHAIEQVLRQDTPVSPRTREPLSQTLVPNITLRKCILQHAIDMGALIDRLLEHERKSPELALSRQHASEGAPQGRRRSKRLRAAADR